MMIMMWGVHTKAQAPTPMPTYKHGLDMQGSNKYNTDSTDITLNKQARWSYVNNKQIYREVENTFNQYYRVLDFQSNSINANENNNEIRIIPNPSSSSFTLNTKEEGALNVYNISGKLVMSKSIKANTEFGNDLEQGIYIIKFVNNRNKLFVLKAIKQ